jgi:hypothetical protein
MTVEPAEPAAPWKRSVLQREQELKLPLPTSRAELLGVEPTRPNPPGFYTSSKLIRGEAIGSIQNRDGLGRSAAKELIKAYLS